MMQLDFLRIRYIELAHMNHKMLKQIFIYLQTVMAHGIYLTDDEITLLKDRGTAVIHCPSSNTCLKSGLCDVQRLKAKEVNIGLGTGENKRIRLLIP